MSVTADHEQLKLYKQTLSRLGLPDQYFFPVHSAQWVKEKNRSVYQLTDKKIRHANAGVRLIASEDPSKPVTSCQKDLTGMLKTLFRLRDVEPFQNVVLSKDISISKDHLGKRIKFGLVKSGNPENVHPDNVRDAKICYGCIRSAISKAGYSLECDTEFDPRLGFQGLLSWAEGVTYQRRFRWLWLPPLLLLLLLMLLPFSSCKKKTEVFPAEAKYRNVIFILDRSGSMAGTLEKAKVELEGYMKRISQSPGCWLGPDYRMNLIAYDDKAISAFDDELKPYTKENMAEMKVFMASIKATNDNVLHEALTLAGSQLKKDETPVTLYIVTDALADNSIITLGQSPKKSITKIFGERKVQIHSMTPRIIAGGISEPQHPGEIALGNISACHEGAFGKKDHKENSTCQEKP